MGKRKWEILYMFLVTICFPNEKCLWFINESLSFPEIDLKKEKKNAVLYPKVS